MVFHRVCAAALLVVGLATTAIAQELIVRDGVSANLRSGPGTSFGVAGRVAPGTVLDQLGRDDADREWIMVRYGDHAAYIHQTLVTRLHPLQRTKDPETVATMRRNRFNKLDAAALSPDGRIFAIHEEDSFDVTVWSYPDLAMLKTLNLPVEDDTLTNLKLDFLTNELLHVMLQEKRSILIDTASSEVVYAGPSYFGRLARRHGDSLLRVAGQPYAQRILDPVTLETLRALDPKETQVTMTNRDGRRQQVDLIGHAWTSRDGRALQATSGEGPGGAQHIFIVDVASGDEVRRSFPLSGGERAWGYSAHGDVVLAYESAAGRSNTKDFQTGAQVTFFDPTYTRYSPDFRFAASYAYLMGHINSYDFKTRKPRVHSKGYDRIEEIFPLEGTKFLISGVKEKDRASVVAVIDLETGEEELLGGNIAPAQIANVDQIPGSGIKIRLDSRMVIFDPFKISIQEYIKPNKPKSQPTDLRSLLLKTYYPDKFEEEQNIDDDDDHQREDNLTETETFSVYYSDRNTYDYFDKITGARYQFHSVRPFDALMVSLAKKIVAQYGNSPDNYARISAKIREDAKRPTPRGRISRIASETHAGRGMFEAEFDRCEHLVRVAGNRQLCVEPTSILSPTNKLIEVDFDTGKLLRQSRDLIAGVVKSMMISEDGKLVYIVSEHDEIVVFDVATLRKLASLHLFDDGREWFIVTPEGFYGGNGTLDDMVGVTYGVSTTHPIGRFRNTLFRPDLVVEALAGDAEGLVRTAVASISLTDILTSGEAPGIEIELLGNEDDRAEVSARLTDTGGGIGRLEWRVNGVTQAHAENRRDFRATLNLAEGENRIQLVANNGRNLIEARSETISVKVENARKPRLFIMSVGVNDYAIEALQLKYATVDAEALAPAIAGAGEGLYEEVFTEILLDGEVTRTNLDKRFRELAGAVRPNDVFVFFAAGHGKTIDGRFFFIPQDFKGTSLASIRDQAIGHSTWQDWFALIPAQKSLLLFDSCESGTLTDTVTGRDLRFQAASDVLGNALGRALISASSGTGVALEGHNGHGVFTYAILEALKMADTNGDGVIDIDEFAVSVEQTVPKIALEAFGESQQPQFKAPQRNFDLLRSVPL